MPEFIGSCHCGAIGYAYSTHIAPEAWSVRACQCSFCRAHGVATTSDPAGSLEFVVRDPAHLVRYRFGLRTADFLLCCACGVYIGAAIDTPNGSFGLININVLQPRPQNVPLPMPVSHTGENPAERVVRRIARWTPLR